MPGSLDVLIAIGVNSERIGPPAKVGPAADGAFAFTSKKTHGGDWKATAEGNGSSTAPFTVFAYCKN
jgi:hypothetical protein